MKKRTAVFALALAAAALLGLSGCGALTPEKLADKVRQAVEETPCGQAELVTTMEMSMADPASGIEVDLGIQVEGLVQTSYDPDTTYEDLEVTVEMMGMRAPTSMEVYILEEEGKAASYVNTEGVWARAELDAAAQPNESVSVAVWDLPAEQLAIDEEAAGLEGAPAICLTARVTGKDVSQAVGFLFSSLEERGGVLPDGDLGDIDWEKVEAQVTTYVDPESYLPLRQEVALSGLDEALSSLLDNDALSLSIRSAGMTVDYTSYEPVEPCVLPEGAREAAAQTQRLLEGDPDNGDGTFTIQESGYYADIQTPEGYALESTGYDEVVFYSEELDRRVRYQMWVTSDSNDSLFWDLMFEEEYLYTEGSGANWMPQYDLIYTDEFGFCVDGFTYPSTRTAGNYYAWTSIDDNFYGWLLVSIYDGGNTRDSSITREEIEALLRQASQYQLPTAQADVEDMLGKLEL